MNTLKCMVKFMDTNTEDKIYYFSENYVFMNYSFENCKLTTCDLKKYGLKKYFSLYDKSCEKCNIIFHSFFIFI